MNNNISATSEFYHFGYNDHLISISKADCNNNIGKAYEMAMDRITDLRGRCTSHTGLRVNL